MDVPLADTLNARWKNDQNGFGFKMLSKMGWSQEKGLGKNEDGIVNSIKAKKRDTGLGLGMIEDTAGNASWGAAATSFNMIQDMLKDQYGSKSPKKSKSKGPTIKVGMK